MAKIGRNDPCPCGSGRKYKKCHLGVVTAPVPRQAIEQLRKAQKEQARLEGLGIRINYVRPTMHQGQRLWAIRSRVYYNRPPRETFHEFIIDILRVTLGRTWWETQAQEPQKHFIMTCFDSFYALKRQAAIPENQESDGLWSVVPDGPTKYLLSLAFDVCSLVHAQELPEPLLARLRDRDQFQGARYEIGIAAILARLGFEIEFLDETTPHGVRHCEFTVSDPVGKHIFAVETKSRHRQGILHVPGQTAESGLLRGDVARLFHGALKQAPGDKPFLIFIDLNAPLTGDIEAIYRGWRADVQAMLRREPQPSTQSPTDFTALYVTNYSYHYDTGATTKGNEVLEILSPFPKHAIGNQPFYDMLGKALKHYGDVPSFDIEGVLGWE